MKRTQLYIDDELWGTLQIRARQAGTSVSNLVRHAVREKYATGRAHRQQAMQDFAGIWRDRADLADSAAYVRALRKGSRLKRLR